MIVWEQIINYNYKYRYYNWCNDCMGTNNQLQL